MSVFFRQLSLDTRGTTSLSLFLEGVTVSDPRVPSLSHTYNDLARRQVSPQQFANATCTKFGVDPVLKDLVFPNPLPPLMSVPLLSAD